MEASPTSTPRDARKTAMAASLSVSLLMLVGKLGAFALTGSTAIFSDAAESVIHLIATGFAAFSLWYAVRPADPGHPYGHGKIAYFSSGFEGALILAAALSILFTSVRALVEGPELRQLGLGLLILAALTAVNLALGLGLVRTGRRTNSLVLISNGQHVLTDMWTSLGVLVGVMLVWLTGISWIDPVVAIFVAINIAWTALQLIRRAIGGLMERVEADATRAILAELDAAVAQGVIASYHQMRHRRVNDQIYVEYHLQLPGDLPLAEAHAHSHAVEDRIAALFPRDEVTVTAHLEPDAHDAAHPEGHTEPADPLRDVQL